MTKLTTSQTANPALAISPKAKNLVDILVSTGCTITEASKLAGYKGNSSRVSASKMLRKPEVQAYMMQEVQRAFGLHSARAVAKLSKLSSDAKSEYVQLEASKDILDRAGFKAPDKHQHLVAGNFSINIDLS
jgi:phage terminase small subunit